MYVPAAQETNKGERQEFISSEHLSINEPDQRTENETANADSELIQRQHISGSSNSQCKDVQVAKPKFQFVEVNRFGKPHNAELRKFVRSNARGRGTQRKIPSMRGTAPRKIISKDLQSPPRTFLEAPGDLIQGSALTGINLFGSLPFRKSPSPYSIPKTQNEEGIDSLDSHEDFVMFGGLLSRSELSTMVAATRSFVVNGTPEFDRWQSRDANTPYSLRMVTGAPVLYLQARTWPFPYALRGPVPKTSLWISESPIPAPDVHARRGCLNRTSPPITFITHSPEYFTYKGETIRWLRNQLSDHEMSASDRVIIGDSIIGVILCLTMWEIGRSRSRESAQHMKGIEQIVNLRGGLHQLGDAFQIKILLCDIYVAIVTNGAPLFHNSRLATPRPAPLPILGLGEYSIPDSPLYQCGNRRLDNILLNSKFCLSSIRILQHMTDLTNAFFSDPPLLNLLLADDFFIIHPANQPSALFSIIQNTAIIHRAAFSFPPRPLSSPLNYQYATAIVNLLSSPDDDETWVRYPGILLWITLVGTVAASNHTERAFFIHFYGKFVSVARWQWWDEIIGALERFFPLRRIADPARG